MLMLSIEETNEGLCLCVCVCMFWIWNWILRVLNYPKYFWWIQWSPKSETATKYLAFFTFKEIFTILNDVISTERKVGLKNGHKNQNMFFFFSFTLMTSAIKLHELLMFVSNLMIMFSNMIWDDPKSMSFSYKGVHRMSVFNIITFILQL